VTDTDRPTWTILVPTIPQRETTFLRLMAVLLPQLDAHEGRVRVLAWRNAGRPHLGELRDQMIAYADASDYVSFIDDDDLVPDYYVAEVVKALDERPDHVGFQLDYTSDTDGVLGHEIVDHSLRHGRWHRNGEGRLVRDFTHIDPVRRELAMNASFAVARKGRAEDRQWVKQLRGWLRTEVYIDKVMYYYIWSYSGSSWGADKVVWPAGGPLPEIDHPHFEWHPKSVA
jgi:glycosyl transferase family 2